MWPGKVLDVFQVVAAEFSELTGIAAEDGVTVSEDTVTIIGCCNRTQLRQSEVVAPSKHAIAAIEELGVQDDGCWLVSANPERSP
jgi:hypothetical protein